MLDFLTTRPDAAAIEAGLRELTAQFGNRLVTSRAVRQQHTNTMTWVTGDAPDAVIFPQSGEDVKIVVGICAKHGIPIIPFGAGSSFEGHVNAPFGGVSLDTRDMNRIISVNAEDFDCVVEPGVSRKQLNEYLRDQGLFFSVDPGADASLGGMASTRASGTTAVRYGTMRDNVLAMKVVTASGVEFSTSRRARKSSAGYDLTRLFVGAEGTLGIITELTLKLHGIPEAASAGVCSFESVQNCCDTAITAIQSGISFARVELLDDVQVRVCNVYSKLAMPEKPTLFVEFHGTDSSVTEQAERFAEIASEFGSTDFRWAKEPGESSRLWQTRHDVFWAQRAYRPGAHVLVTDVCVPISRLAECVAETKRDIEHSGIVAPIVGHIGDGNFHTSPLVMLDDADEVKNAKAFADRLTERALAMEGTCTGEHGIGEGKKHFMTAEHGKDGVAAMRAIKHALDPHNIMNPCKIF